MCVCAVFAVQYADEPGAQHGTGVLATLRDQPTQEPNRWPRKNVSERELMY